MWAYAPIWAYASGPPTCLGALDDAKCGLLGLELSPLNRSRSAPVNWLGMWVYAPIRAYAPGPPTRLGVQADAKCGLYRLELSPLNRSRVGLSPLAWHVGVRPDQGVRASPTNVSWRPGLCNVWPPWAWTSPLNQSRVGST